MKPAVLVLTCDIYEPYWRGFWHFMERHWDFDIESPIFMCNEEREIGGPAWCGQIHTGRGTFVENLRKSLKSVDGDDVFLMLEDFWPIAPMKKSTFEALYGVFRDLNLDALQVSNYTPYYDVRPSGRRVLDQELLEFSPTSNWVFNFQARFWRKESLLKFLTEPRISEREVGSAITAEMASDEIARRSADMKALLFHYLWYPLSGVSYRGQMTEFGMHLQNIVDIDRHVEEKFSRPDASRRRQECSA